MELVKKEHIRVTVELVNKEHVTVPLGAMEKPRIRKMARLTGEKTLLGW